MCDWVDFTRDRCSICRSMVRRSLVALEVDRFSACTKIRVTQCVQTGCSQSLGFKYQVLFITFGAQWFHAL